MSVAHPLCFGTWEGTRSSPCTRNCWPWGKPVPLLLHKGSPLALTPAHSSLPQPSMAKAAAKLCALLILLLLAVLCCQSRAQRVLAVPDKCCFNFQMRRIKRDNIIACYPTSPECPHKAVIFRVRSGKEICSQASRAWVKKYQQSFPVSSFSIPSQQVCGFCKRADCDPEVLGPLCRQDGLCVHENCLYHASGLYQRGADEEGFYGFLFPDIQEKLKRVAQKRCCICRQPGASVSCRARRCPRTFHYPCGSERGCVSQFFGEFKSFCWKHRPVQRVWAVQQEQTLCLICQEAVAERPHYDTLVCPTCTSAWFHRRCIQGQALSSALHHFRCPLCLDVATFQKEMFRLGIKIPDRDAAWEEDGAFADHYQRHSSCDASQCLCPVGREEAAVNGPWRMLLCHSCGSRGTHQRCSNLGEEVDS
ncbi:PHD finger protein 7-like, partial [Amazona ochrocephala]